MTADPDAWASHRPNPPDPDPEPVARFATLPAFVDWLTDEVYRVDVFDTTDRTWCPDWWQHPPAAILLDALWHAYEAMKEDPATGVSMWIRDHVYPHMDWLMSQYGPMAGCHWSRGHSPVPLRRLPVNPPPDDWWTPTDSGL